MAERDDVPGRGTPGAGIPNSGTPRRESPEHEIPEQDVPEQFETETRRATGMGNPGTFHDAGTRRGRGSAVERARRAAGGRLEETAQRVRTLGDRAAARNPVLGRTRPLAYGAATGIDQAADYVRTRELDEMRTDLETQVRRHPLASVAVAFLAGYTVRRIF